MVNYRNVRKEKEKNHMDDDEKHTMVDMAVHCSVYSPSRNHSRRRNSHGACIARHNVMHKGIGITSHENPNEIAVMFRHNSHGVGACIHVCLGYGGVIADTSGRVFR